jgi:hypothetical protein
VQRVGHARLSRASPRPLTLRFSCAQQSRR